jgi:hypothetical protein
MCRRLRKGTIPVLFILIIFMVHGCSGYRKYSRFPKSDQEKECKMEDKGSKKAGKK